MSSDVVNDVAQSGFAQRFTQHEVDNVSPECDAKSRVDGRKRSVDAEHLIAEALHQFGRNVLGSEAVFRNCNCRTQFLKFLPRCHAGGKRSDAVKRWKQRCAEELALGGIAPAADLGKQRQQGVDCCIALRLVGGNKPFHTLFRCRDEVLVADHGKAVDCLHQVERWYRLGECLMSRYCRERV